MNIEPYAIDATRLHLTMKWVVSSSILGRFGRHRRGASEAPTSAQVIYDFQVDVWRVAVSIYNHALTCVEIKS